MIKVRLDRIKKTDDYIIGKLYLGKEFLCYTMEPSWKGNKKNSCVRCGKYDCYPHAGFKYPDSASKKRGIKVVWRLNDLQTRRTAILLHNGNKVKHTNGCILVGSDYIENLDMITNSRDTLYFLATRLPQMFELTIRENLQG